LIAAIAAAQLVWQPAVKANEAKASHDRWHALFNKLSQLNESQIEKEISQISDRGSQILGSLRLAAHLSASVQLNRPTDKLPTMPNWQKFIVFCARGLPVFPQ